MDTMTILIMESGKMTVEEREQLMLQYIEQILENADMDFLLNIASEYLEQNLSYMSDDDLLEEIRDFYPHLLGEE